MMKILQIWPLLLGAALLLIACERQTAATQPAGLPQPASQAAATPMQRSAIVPPASTQAATIFATEAAEPTSAPASLAPTLAASAVTTPHTRATSAPAATATPAPSVQASATPKDHPVYTFPVQSDAKISYGKSHHDYPAADIFCAIGSRFVAVTSGVVDFISREDRWDSQVNDGATRGGLAVAIVGDDGVRYYGSHLSEVAEGIAPGTRVTAGQLLGLTGHSGDAIHTPPHLHFGISRPTTPDDWQVRRGEVGPYQYLQAWQRGKNMAPKLP